MADLSTKKISEAYPGLIHSVQSGNAISGTVTTTNLQLKTGSDGASPFHFDNNKFLCYVRILIYISFINIFHL